MSTAAATRSRRSPKATRKAKPSPSIPGRDGDLESLESLNQEDLIRQRSYAVAIAQGSRITSIAQRHVSLGEAAGFLRGYNHLNDERQAVIVQDPIAPLGL